MFLGKSCIQDIFCYDDESTSLFVICLLQLGCILYNTFCCALSLYFINITCMNISIKNGFLTLQSDDALCTLTSTSVIINEYVMDFPGEYERRGVFVEIREMSGQLGYILTVEGRTLIYITEGVTLELLEVFRDLNNKDMVICPVNEALWKTVESWEPSVVLVH